MYRNISKLTLILALIGLWACDDSTGPDGSGGGGGSSSSELGRILEDAGQFEAVVDEYSETESEEYDGGNEQYYCTKKTVDLTQGFSNFAQFDPNTQVIFPGNLLQGHTLDDATPAGIPVARGPGRVVMTLVNGSSSVTRDLDEVGLGSVYTAMNEIIADTPDDLPARSTFTMQRVSSREQLGVAIQAEYSSIGTEVQGSFSYESDVKYNRFLVKLTQSYYTIVFEAPTDPGDFFGSGVTTEQLSRYVQPGNPAAYVSSVTYGRIFYLLIQSTDSVQEMEASIDASFNGAVASGSIGGDVKYVSELSELKIGGYAIGGDSQLANAALLGNFEDLRTFVIEGDRITTGQPISYTVNAANDPAKQLEVKVATSYDIVDCTPLGATLDEGIAWYRGDQGVSTKSWGGGIANDGVYRWADLFGDSQRDATVAIGGPDVGARWFSNEDAVSFEFQQAYMTGRMRIPGSALRNTDYTIFAVAKRLGLQPGDNRTIQWLWGDGDVANQVIKIAWDDDNTVSISHGGDQKISATTLRPVYSQYQVFTFRFSQAEGLSMYINGLKVAEDPTITTPIELFTGASIGVSDANGGYGVGFATLEIKELQIYGLAATDAQRGYIETTLLERYGI